MLLTTGCSQSILRMDVDGLQLNEISTIKTQNENIFIVTVDGEKSASLLTYMVSNWANEAHIKPGSHQFNILYKKGRIESKYMYNLKTEAGHTYLLKSHVGYKNAFIWFKDLTTGKLVGDIQSSVNEPITSKNKIINNSNYFTFEPPQKDNWTIAYRNNDQIHMVKNGNSLDETYAISITPLQLPSLNTKNEFIKYIKKEMNIYSDQTRFNTIKSDIKEYNERSDYCVNYHSIAEDKKAVKKSNVKKSMILNIVSYICRHPNNKNIGISYGYSQRYYQGNQDKELAQKAIETFKQLKF